MARCQDTRKRNGNRNHIDRLITAIIANRPAALSILLQLPAVVWQQKQRFKHSGS